MEKGDGVREVRGDGVEGGEEGWVGGGEGELGGRR